MSNTRNLPALLFVGLFTAETALFEQTIVRLTSLYGKVLDQSAILPFDQTDYYTPEMGANLKRLFVAFEFLIQEDQLPDIKNTCNTIEDLYRQPVSAGRGINIDPGYMAHARVVLGTTKNYAHRIYLGQGIFAELTYVIQEKRWTILPWTYPDYRTETVRAFFEALRIKYLKLRREALGLG